MNDRAALLSQAVLCVWLVAGSPVVAQDGAGGFGPAFRPVGQDAAGLSIGAVTVALSGTTGDAARDAALRARARAATAGLLGQSYQPVLVEAVLGTLRGYGGVAAASHGTRYEGAGNRLGLTVTLTLAAPEAAPGPAPRPRFPVIHEDDRTKLTFIIGGGVGVYADMNPWFGAPALFNRFSPVAGNLPEGDTAWPEGYLEFGIGGATRVAASDFYLFGAASGLFSASRGQDVFRDDNRDFLHPDKGYVGLLYADPETGNTARLSVGRQTWTLNTGFLISMISGSSNAGERGATYLGPRNTTDFSALATGAFDRTRFSVFYIDPDEIEDIESNTTFAGVNLGYRFSDAVTADLSLITIPRSDATYATPDGTRLPRKGTTTFGLHALHRPDTADHLWMEGEAYYQTNADYDMAAWAYYGTLGHIWQSHPWSPSLSYRYAQFSGDDPATDRFERFDSMMSNGFGTWLPGMNFGKVYRNANLVTHRVQANVSPRDGMNLTLSWNGLQADQRNNLGANPALATLTSRDIGQEFSLTLRWGLNRNTFLQAVASRALPGRALRDIGADDPWTTLQASLYVSF